MGFGPFSTGDKTNTTNQTDQRVLGQASDQAVLGLGNSQIGGGLNTSGTASGQYADTVGTGATNLRTSGGNVNSGGILAQGSSQVNVHNENVDAGVIGAYGQNLKDVLETQASADSVRDVAQQNFLTGITGSLARLATGQQGIDANAASGGDIQRNRIVLYVVLGVLALLGLIYWKSK